MDFFYYDNNNKVKNLHLHVNSKWNLKTDNNYLNTIFSFVDNGDGIIQESELSILSKLFSGKGKDEKTAVKNEDREHKDIICADKVLKGNFEELNNIENPVEFLKAYRTLSGDKSLFLQLFTELQAGNIDQDTFFEHLNILSDKLNDYTSNYQDEDATYFTGGSGSSHLYGDDYWDIISKTKEYISQKAKLDKYYASDENNKAKMDEILSFIKDRLDIEINDIVLIRQTDLLFGFTFNNNLDIEKMKLKVLENPERMKKYINDVAKYKANGFGNTEDLILYADAVEADYERFEFDIHNSSISDLVEQSGTMREEMNKNLVITPSYGFGNDSEITIQNTKTGEIRKIDLKKLTNSTKYGNRLGESIREIMMTDKLALWELAVEIKEVRDIHDIRYYDAAAAYDIDSDALLATSNYLNSYTLIHEMIHALMATMIDGENTFNELQFDNLVKTFEEEKREYDNKFQDTNSYSYCSTNIHEFAAEAGCLWLTGKSASEFTIAKHFPNSYRLLVQLVEEIRSKTEGRNMHDD